MKKIMLLISALGLINSAVAEIYSCGPGCYTSSPKNGTEKASLGHRIGSYTSAGSPRPSTRTASNTTTEDTSARAQPVAHRATPSVRPATTTATQAVASPRMNAARASGRRSILEQELNNERNALAAAQQALVSGRASNGQADAAHQARVRQLESAVLDRQQNIQALQRELSRM